MHLFMDDSSQACQLVSPPSNMGVPQPLCGVAPGLSLSLLAPYLMFQAAALPACRADTQMHYRPVHLLGVCLWFVYVAVCLQAVLACLHGGATSSDSVEGVAPGLEQGPCVAHICVSVCWP